MNDDATGSARQYPTAQSVQEFADNIARVRARVDAAAVRAGRQPADVRLLPVSKTVPEDRLRLAISAGATLLGENKVQEAQRKAHNLSDIDGLEWAVIGHLQTNKAKYVARFATEFHALDRLRAAEALQRRLESENRTLTTYVQVNTSDEDSKFGLDVDKVESFMNELASFNRLRVVGLMTLAVFSSDLDRVRKCFQALRQLRDHLCQTAPGGIQPAALSMGMSGDFETAIAEGATTVRVGQAIFGARPTPDSYYWPSDNSHSP